MRLPEYTYEGSIDFVPTSGKIAPHFFKNMIQWCSVQK